MRITIITAAIALMLTACADAPMCQGTERIAFCGSPDNRSTAFCSGGYSADDCGVFLPSSRTATCDPETGEPMCADGESAYCDTPPDHCE